jgi:hypothetical protein
LTITSSPLSGSLSPASQRRIKDAPTQPQWRNKKTPLDFKITLFSNVVTHYAVAFALSEPFDLKPLSKRIILTSLKISSLATELFERK